LIMSVHIARLHIIRITLAFMSVNTMGRTSDSPYSSDWTSCDFYLFDYANKSLIRKKFTDREEFLEAINHTLENIE
jgi:hypothetical protein